MTDQSSPSATEQSTGSNEEQAVTGGRYLYCLVDITTAELDTMSTRGVGDNSVYVIEEGTVGAVVHDCETIYSTENPEQVKKRILRHQHVVDAAGDVFGTPLPMRFNTVLEGGDTGVTQWLHGQHDRIREALTSFADTWEYRIRLFWEPSTFEDEIADQDDQLQELQQRQQRAGAGKAFLLEKQYDKRLRELKQEHRAELNARLKETVTPVVNELIEQDPHSQLSEPSAATEGEQVARLAVLADATDESALGDRLDELVEQNGVRIRFTGAWPPYTFAPDIG
ncbi:gas vesicle protein GvpL [Halopenitus sp. H-Gu1]|uniref:gas vesicle protein GvpL n=1 Tax=Halopenitus sp. H-Gu1 TaxID=3242697 RepID=UPI00359D56A1